MSPLIVIYVLNISSSYAVYVFTFLRMAFNDYKAPNLKFIATYRYICLSCFCFFLILLYKLNLSKCITYVVKRVVTCLVYNILYIIVEQ